MRLAIYSIISGLLLAFSWPATGFFPLVFIAWLPLLFVEDYLRNEKKNNRKLKLFGLAYLSFIVWNIAATWWVKNASFEGALLAFLANSLLMTGVFTIASGLRERLPGKYAFLYFPVLWTAFEYLHHDWDLSWPWLTLGNAAASMPELVQWYSFTGTTGGSWWILLVNIFFYRALRKRIANPELPVLKLIRLPLLIILVPSVLSLIQYMSYSPRSEQKIQLAIVQPNIDPYGMKFNAATLDEQLNVFFNLARSVCDSNTQWLLGPETALVGSMDEKRLEEYPRIQKIREFLKEYPRMNLLIGAETHRLYMPGEERSSTARPTRDPDVFYDSYNTALLINQGNISIYHKSKLVPGVEQMPFPWLFKHIESLAIDLGGATGTLGKQDDRSVFTSAGEAGKVAPAICYESVYGDFMQEYIRRGAGFIAVITNDGWWGDTPGYKQHLAFARLRAIESRRDVVRAANTGISAVINQRGDIIDSRPYWVPASLRAEINLNTQMTVFSLTGDVIGMASAWMSLFLIVYIRLIIPFSARGRKKNPA